MEPGLGLLPCTWGPGDLRNPSPGWLSVSRCGLKAAQRAGRHAPQTTEDAPGPRLLTSGPSRSPWLGDTRRWNQVNLASGTWTPLRVKPGGSLACQQDMLGAEQGWPPGVADRGLLRWPFLLLGATSGPLKARDNPPTCRPVA